MADSNSKPYALPPSRPMALDGDTAESSDSTTFKMVDRHLYELFRAIDVLGVATRAVDHLIETMPTDGDYFRAAQAAANGVKSTLALIEESLTRSGEELDQLHLRLGQAAHAALGPEDTRGMPS